MFIKEEILYRLFPYMETMMTLFSAWAFRDTINTTLQAFGAKPGTAVGVSILWIYAISVTATGLVLTVILGRRMQTYSKKIQKLRQKGIRFEYLYRVEKHEKEYVKLAIKEWKESMPKQKRNTK